MSPEFGKILDHRSDLFSLGLVYELVTMRRAFRSDSPEISMKRILEGNLVRPPNSRIFLELGGSS